MPAMISSLSQISVDLTITSYAHIQTHKQSTCSDNFLLMIIITAHQMVVSSLGTSWVWSCVCWGYPASSWSTRGRASRILSDDWGWSGMVPSGASGHRKFLPSHQTQPLYIEWEFEEIHKLCWSSHSYKFTTNLTEPVQWCHSHVDIWRDEELIMFLFFT